MDLGVIVFVLLILFVGLTFIWGVIRIVFSVLGVLFGIKVFFNGLRGRRLDD